jgi:hypothetical protein
MKSEGKLLTILCTNELFLTLVTVHSLYVSHNSMMKNQKYIYSAIHTQILKQQKQLNGRNHQVPFNINTEC